MSVLSKFSRLIVAATLFLTGQAAVGQTYHPFAEPLQFDPDWQFFSPIQLQDVEELSAKKRASYGWYGSYDRLYMWVSRPQTESSNTNGDFTWGNRYDFGWMNEKETGWAFSMTHVDGPNEYDNIYQYRVNVFNADDDQTDSPPPTTFPRVDRNDRTYNERVYILQDSLNVGKYSNFEINKTWRLEPYRYGGILEPLIGLRYSKWRDIAINDSYVTYNTPANPAPAVPDGEILTNYNTNIDNDMFGGQIGFRYFKYYKRWQLSTDLRTFALQNFQNRDLTIRQYTTEYDSGAVDADVVRVDNATGSNQISSSNDEFVIGFDIRADAAYQITRYISLRGGWSATNFAKGIWRGANPGYGNQFVNDRDLFLTGFNFGVTLNR